jgi:hypothetical protein
MLKTPPLAKTKWQKPQKAEAAKKTYEKPVSLYPLDFETALRGLLVAPVFIPKGPYIRKKIKKRKAQ